MEEFEIRTDIAKIRDLRIEANFEDLTAAVREISAPYQNLVVLPETVKNAASDRARLRKLRTRLDEQRKEVKTACMAPVKAYEEALAPAFAEIDKAVENIDTQVKKFESQAVEEKLAELEAFFNEHLNEAVEGYVSWAKIREMHPKWVNKGYELTQAKNDIMLDLGHVESGLAALRGYPQQHKAVLLDEFKRRYDLGDVVARYARIMEVEAYERQRAERKKAEDAARAQQEAEKPQTRETTPQAAENPAEGQEMAESAIQEPIYKADFRVYGTREQLMELKKYMKAKGIRVEPVPREG